MNRYLIKPPFNGVIQSNTYFKNGVEYVQYSGYLYNNKGPDLTLEQYLKLDGNDGLIIVSDDDLNVLLDSHYQSLVTLPVKITIEEWHDKLEVLPPCRWQNYGIFSGFHVSERITGNIVSWYFKSRESAYTFDDTCDLTYEQITNKLAGL